ncbi:MAG: LytTR family transcriptional regulator DNA-binding domain-containing protein [Bacteroidales bacterium]|nr:LytTR family transcriptional regulator DNA-binding domain-containing protein [Bacteroidales bacterium]
MLDFLNKTYPFNDDPKQNLKLSLGLSLGMFLFILFFQPIDLKTTDFNNKLLIIAGFGGITFFSMITALIIAPSVLPRLFMSGKWNFKRDLFLNTCIWTAISVASIFYARYVGQTKITFYSVFMIVFISLVPVAILIITNQFEILKAKLQEALNLSKKPDNTSIEINEPEKIEFESENKSEKISLQLNEIIMLRSADNYVEIFWEKEGEIKKKLIRQTLHNTEYLLAKYTQIIRCHRTCLFNTNYVSKLNIYPQGYKLKLKYIEEEIPVSRQYLLKVKEALQIK